MVISKTLDVQTWCTHISMNRRTYNTQYGGIIPAFYITEPIADW